MGDRANVVIRDSWPDDLGPKEAVFLYGHWSGQGLPETLRVALSESTGRWSDGSYLARMIFDRMVGSDQGQETGYGISTRLTDNEYDLLVLLPDEQRLVVLPEDDYMNKGFAALEGKPTISFSDYAGAEERTWDNLTEQ